MRLKVLGGNHTITTATQQRCHQLINLSRLEQQTTHSNLFVWATYSPIAIDLTQNK
jgi:hypothetical protein